MGGFFAVQSALEFDCWLALTVVGEAEGTEMDRDARRGAYFFVSADGVLGGDVYGAHKPLRTIGADGEKR